MLSTFNFSNLELYREFPEEALSIALHPSGLYILVGFSDKLRLMNLLIDDIRTFKEFPMRTCKEVHIKWIRMLKSQYIVVWKIGNILMWNLTGRINLIVSYFLSVCIQQWRTSLCSCYKQYHSNFLYHHLWKCLQPKRSQWKGQGHHLVPWRQ